MNLLKIYHRRIKARLPEVAEAGKNQEKPAKPNKNEQEVQRQQKAPKGSEAQRSV